MSQAHGDLAAPNLTAQIRFYKPSVVYAPPIMRLPFEITLSIFRNCDPDIKSRLTLTHTCRSWMSITSQTASLWNSVQIMVNCQAEDERFDRLLLLLEMQLDRAAGKPLHVIWESNQTSTFDSRLIGLLRRKGPFSQWKTLHLGLMAFPPRNEAVFTPEDAFTNLESIAITSSFVNCVIVTLNRTTTSRLQVIEHRHASQVTLRDCMPMVQRASCIKTDSIDIRSLPKNVIRLESGIQSHHEFPYLETYHLDDCLFQRDHSINLGRLTTLHVAEILHVHKDCEVTLPSLRQLRCGTISLRDHAKISTPVLANLFIGAKESDSDYYEMWPDITTRAIWKAGYLLSPSSLLSVDMPLPDGSLVKLLELSSRVSKVEMSFSDESCAIRVLERISMVDREDTLREGEPVWLCGQLTELRLNFWWAIADVGSWRDRAAQVVENRLRLGIFLRIYASWLGEGTYVLLA
jgi:F-box-like